MSDYITQNIAISEFELWEKRKKQNALFSFTLELTARCNNSCRHCYINLPENDKQAMAKELSFGQIKKIVDEAVEQGALWCLLTGGEPLLRHDFEDIYIYLKKKGLLVSVFTNAVLINENHIKLFKKYPPRNLEVTVYGVTEKTYGRVTKRPDNFELFLNGLNLLLANNIKVCLKSVFIKSNFNEFNEISEFCRKYSHDKYRFDPLIHLRLDGNEKRNKEIKAQRLSPEEIVYLERCDQERSSAMRNHCDSFIYTGEIDPQNNYLFKCGAGLHDFVVSYDGFFRLCSSLYCKDLIYDLKNGNLAEARNDFVFKVRNLKSSRSIFLEKCNKCRLVNLCIWCPAHSFLETGSLDSCVDYFCEIAQERSYLCRENV